MNLKKTSLAVFLSLMLSSNINAQKPVVTNYGKMWAPHTYQTILTNNTRAEEEDQGALVEKILSCPENSIYSNSWVNDGSFSIGTMCADESREGMSCIFYSSIEANLFKINGLRFFGEFNYYDPNNNNWLYCDERGNIDEDGNMTEPIRFRISFNKEDENGNPGETVYSKEFDIIGENTGIMVGDNSSGYGYIYSFDVDFNEDVLLETGYVGITAVDMGDKPSCWFSMFTSSSANGHGIVGIDKTDWMYAFGPACFCLKGTGEMSAKKAVKFERFLSPSRTANGKHEKVAVEISNAGSEPLSGVELELWNGDEMICSEKIDKTIEPLSEYGLEGKHKHIFNKHVDCSNIGDNIITVKNAYKEDEKFCTQEIRKILHVNANGEAVESMSELPDYFFIKHVNVGSIDNTSEATSYSDYTDFNTEIALGKKLEMLVETENDCNVQVWVDWNNNGDFGDSEESLGMTDENGIININVPENLDLKPGAKRMRIICSGSWEFPSYSGSYGYGETEDYTLTLVKNDNQPSLVVDNELVELTASEPEKLLSLTNNGDAALEVNAEINYVLPGSPDGLNAYHSTNKLPEDIQAPVMSASPVKTVAVAPKKDEKIGYVMGYDRNPYSCVSLQAEEGIFGQLFPAKMVSNLEGMTLSSVDVYIGDVPSSTSIIIYEEGDKENHVGAVITEQNFNAVADSWNRVALNNPIKLNGSNGIVVAIKMQGFPAESYCMGIDYKEAVIGYGDLVMAGDYWWSMHDLDINANFCIRANVTGEKTPAISWLDADKYAMNISDGNNDVMNVSYNGKDLSNYLYSAIVELSTNDELRRTVRIPVYYINGTETGVISANIGEAEVVYDGNVIKIISDKELFNISVYDINGQLVENIEPENGETIISTENYNKGIYIISLMYNNGNRKGIKIPVMR